jgi:transposase InsO family protein
MRNQAILKQIKEIKREHPLWGFRRVWAYLRFQKKVLVNKKRIYRIMREENLLVNQMKKLKAIRKNYPRKIRASRPNEIWGIDMTKVITKTGWINLVIVLDWHTKKIVGYHADTISKAEQWLSALNMAVMEQFPDGIKEHGQLSLISDNGSQPTSVKFMKETSMLGIKQIFASYNNPKGNADTERVIRTLKEDLVWPREFENIYDFKDALRKWVNDYNTDYPHSSLGYMTPAAFEMEAKLKAIELKKEASSSNLFFA